MGTYRMIPNEKYVINRPIRRKKNLVFLKKDNKHLEHSLFKANNQNLGLIEAEVKAGIINIKDIELSNKKVFRPEKEGYILEYMNIYKKNIVNKKICDIKHEDKNENFESIIIKDSVEQVNCDVTNDFKSDGFTVYGDEIENFKYKTYHELIYDGRIETVSIKLVCKKKYQKL